MTPDFFRARLGEMVNPKDPMVILSRQMPWEDIEACLSRFFVRSPQPGRVVAIDDLFGTTAVCQGGGLSPAGRKPLPIRLMASLLYLAHHDHHSDEAVLNAGQRACPISTSAAAMTATMSTASRVMPAKSAAFVRPSVRTAWNT